jgi:putative endonuclease
VPYPLQSSFWRADGRRKQFSVYIVSNTSMTLYTGVTNDLRRRVFEHKNGIGCEFTSRYHFDRLVYFEAFEIVVDAIAREKAIKGMNRRRKIENDQDGERKLARSVGGALNGHILASGDSSPRFAAPRLRRLRVTGTNDHSFTEQEESHSNWASRRKCKIRN